jgi:hypothetical protein
LAGEITHGPQWASRRFALMGEYRSDTMRSNSQEGVCMARLLKKSHGVLTRALAMVALIFAILVLFQAKVFSLSPAQALAIGVGSLAIVILSM